jgi:GNAT superfamily N-acetyltransferase
VATEHDWQQLNAGAAWQGRRLTEKTLIERFLLTDRLYAAYAVADLEPGYFERCAWYGAQTQDELRSLVLVYAGLEPPALFLMGDAAGLLLLLGSLIRERQAYVTCRPEHQKILETYYALGRPLHMKRMVVSPASFRPDRRHSAERLGPLSLGEAHTLFQQGGHHVIGFGPESLALGCFYGIRRQGQLVAIAGTHIVAPSSGIAAIGNVFTHPAYRNQGLASVCTSRVTEELLQRRLTVVLNVEESNAPAIAVYRRLGYEEHCKFIEGPATRRNLR